MSMPSAERPCRRTQRKLAETWLPAGQTVGKAGHQEDFKKTQAYDSFVREIDTYGR